MMRRTMDRVVDRTIDFIVPRRDRRAIWGGTSGISDARPSESEDAKDDSRREKRGVTATRLFHLFFCCRPAKMK